MSQIGIGTAGAGPRGRVDSLWWGGQRPAASKIKGDQHQHSHEKSGDVTKGFSIKNLKIQE